MAGMNIVEHLNSFELPEAGLDDLDLKVDFSTMLNMFGNYCRNNHIKSLNFIGKCNPNIRLVSQNFGKTISIEIYHPSVGVTQRMTEDWDVKGYYKIRDEYGYEIFFRGN